MVRFLLLSILLTLVLRSLNGLWVGMIRGMQNEPRAGGPTRGPSSVSKNSVHMERDPVCGTFVVPERAVVLTTGNGRLHFCSAECRDKYSENAASMPVHGRTA
jgi:YHS domain-containing protein